MENLSQDERVMLQEMVVALFPEYRYHQIEGEYYKLMNAVDLTGQNPWRRIHYLELCIAEIPKRLKQVGDKDSRWLRDLVSTMSTGIAIGRLQEIIKILYREYQAVLPTVELGVAA